jgi:hypothetical protein
MRQRPVRSSNCSKAQKKHNEEQMATITKRGKGWYVQVRRKGFPARFGTFETKVQAASWARGQEALLRAHDERVGNDWDLTLGELLLRYRPQLTVDLGDEGETKEETS